MAIIQTWSLTLIVSAVVAAGEPELITFRSKDNLPITADLYHQHEDANTLFIVLYHQAGWSRGEYREIAPRLNEEGFNCMAVDLRSGAAINDVVNETHRRAKAADKGVTYLHALPDIEASLEYARQHYAKGKLIAWGSSYSAALVLKVAGDKPKLADGVLSFAPGEYFGKLGNPGNWIGRAAKNIRVPVFITSARHEKKAWDTIYKAIPDGKKSFYLPSTKGNHGSRALWKRFEDSSGYWGAVTEFLETHFGSPQTGWSDYPDAIRAILDNTKPLQHPRGTRLPLLLWAAHRGVVDDNALQERIIRDLDRRGVAVIASWNPGPGNRDGSLAAAMRTARIQQKLGLPVCVNANACMYGFYNGDAETAHLDDNGETFFDPSIPGKIGCPFRIDHRYEPMTEQIDFFVRAYKEANLPLDFVYGDWEVDGPLEINRAWEAAKRCVVCRKEVPDVASFAAFQKAVRVKRSDATRRCYSEPILSRYPKALVGNYAVYPHDGFRYWYDYFEEFVDYHPHRMDGRAPYRSWYDDFPLTGYTFAMPVVYPWARHFLWYDFPSPDFRWFYNMLLAASNACRHTAPEVPIIPFVHWHTIYGPVAEDPSIKQFSGEVYQELLWHMLLQGTDTFFVWCPDSQAPKEISLVHEVWADALQYADWLERGTPISFDVPTKQQPVISGLRIGDRVLVRRTDFDEDHNEPVAITVDGKMLSVPKRPGQCQILKVP